VKRFWQTASVIAQTDGFGVALDGKPVRVPEGGPLLLPTQPLADAICAEWQAAGGAPGGEMSYADLPLTRIAGTAQERIVANPEPVVLEIARYGESDLLCYRATHPQTLARRQEEQWQPWLDWAADTLSARLEVAAGVIHVAQPTTSLATLAAEVAAVAPYRLAALGILVPSYGSLVLGLAVNAGALTADMAHEIATLDERFQAEAWGWDHEAEIRMKRVAEDVAVAGHFLALCGD